MAGPKHYVLYAISALFDFLRRVLPAPVWGFIDVLTLLWVSLVRFGSGVRVAGDLDKCKRPAKPLILYEFEACPFCRKVRETLTVLDIDHYVYPCPRESLRAYGLCMNSKFRPEVLKAGKKLQFPYLVDPNTGKSMYESDKINQYLWQEYGSQAVVPWTYWLAQSGPLRGFAFTAPVFFRPCLTMGMLRAPAHRPEKPLELWGFEGSPVVRRVREVLCTLEIPYLNHVIAKGATEKRAQFKKTHGSFGTIRDRLGLLKFPFLKDPNTNVELFESSDIVQYLAVSSAERASLRAYIFPRIWGIDDRKQKNCNPQRTNSQFSRTAWGLKKQQLEPVVDKLVQLSIIASISNGTGGKRNVARFRHA